MKSWKLGKDQLVTERARFFLNDKTNYNKVDIERVIDFDELKNMAVGRLKQKLQILKDEFSKL